MRVGSLTEHTAVQRVGSVCPADSLLPQDYRNMCLIFRQKHKVHEAGWAGSPLATQIKAWVFIMSHHIPMSISHMLFFIEKICQFIESTQCNASTLTVSLSFVKNRSVWKEETECFLKLWLCSVSTCFIKNEIIQQTDVLYTFHSFSQQKTSLDWGHYCCLLPVLPFYFTTVVLIFCFPGSCTESG